MHRPYAQSSEFGRDGDTPRKSCSIIAMIASKWLLALFTVAIAATLCILIIRAIRPFLNRYTLAKPNARSSHKIPTPQGAGIGVILATLIAAGAAGAFFGVSTPAAVFAATLFIAVVGLADDVRFIPVVPRLVLQTLAVGIVVLAVSTAGRIFPGIPGWLEYGLLLLAGLWFVNLVNFMDGLDWMTAAEVIPVCAALTMLGCLGNLSSPPTIAAAALGGAMIGFAPFNRPVAKLFLGDVGSLPIGLLLGWCLLEFALQQGVVAALLLPLYYLADATVTLFRRLKNREAVWLAHRSHFYQRATDNGFTVLQIVGEVFTLNIFLAALAFACVSMSSDVLRISSLLVGCCAVAAVMWHFSQRRLPFAKF